MRIKQAILLLLITTAAFLSQVRAETPADAGSDEIASATVTTAAVASNSEEIEIASTTPAMEPFARTSLKDLHKSLASLSDFYRQGSNYQTLALALTAAENDDRFFRRSCEFILREAGLRALSPYSALLIFPRWLETANLIEHGRIEKTIKDFADRMVRDPAAREMLLKQLDAQLKNSEALKNILRQVGDAISLYCTNSEKQLNLRNIAGELPDFFKKQNRALLRVVSEQNARFAGLLNQLDHHQTYCRQYLNFLQNSQARLHGAAAGVRLSRILQSCRDFANYQLNYKESLLASKERLGKFIKQRQQDLEKLAAAHFRNSADIKAYAKKFPARDLDTQPETVFNAESQLKDVLAILSLLAEQPTSAQPGDESAPSVGGPISTQELFEKLHNYINGTHWITDEITEDFEAISQP